MTFISVLGLVIGPVLLIFGGQFLVDGSSFMARKLGMSPVFIGLTVVAFGTSAPELVVSVFAVIDGKDGVAIGNVVGSNIANILFVLGLTASLAPVVVSTKLLRLDVPILLGLSLVLLIFCLNASIGLMEGVIFLAGLVAFNYFSFKTASPEEVRERIEGYEVPPEKVSSMRSLLQIFAGLILLAVGSEVFLRAAVDFAGYIGLSEAVIGLTIVALATSLPEAVTSLVAVSKGEKDIAIGNILGSNFFNILAILGVASLVAWDGLHIPLAMIRFDIPIMIAVTFACLPIFFTGYRINRWEGLLFVAYYGLYITYLILRSEEHEHLELFSNIMLLGTIPLTLLTLGVLAARQYYSSRSSSQ